MTEEQKNKTAEALKQGAEHAAAAAKTAQGWQRVAYIALAVLAYLGTLYLTGCTTSHAAQAATWAEVAHDVYHLAHPGEPCLLARPGVTNWEK